MYYKTKKDKKKMIIKKNIYLSDSQVWLYGSIRGNYKKQKNIYYQSKKEKNKRLKYYNKIRKQK